MLSCHKTQTPDYGVGFSVLTGRPGRPVLCSFYSLILCCFNFISVLTLDAHLSIKEACKSLNQVGALN